MAEKDLPAQIKKSTASDNRVRIGIVQTDGSVQVQGTRVQTGFLGGIALNPGDSVALIRQDKTWLCLGKVYGSHTASIEMQAGEELFTFVGVSSAFVDVIFDRPFSAPPAVTGNIATTAGVANLWFVRCASVTTVGFRLLVSAAAVNTWTDVPVQWQAQMITQ